MFHIVSFSVWSGWLGYPGAGRIPLHVHHNQRQVLAINTGILLLHNKLHKMYQNSKNSAGIRSYGKARNLYILIITSVRCKLVLITSGSSYWTRQMLCLSHYMLHNVSSALCSGMHHAPLGARSAKHRHHVNCFIQGVYLKSCWIVFIHVVRGNLGGLFQFSKGEAVKIIASVSSGVRTMWPNRKKCRAWIIAERCGCLCNLTSPFCTWWYHSQFPTAFTDRHYWSRASILSASILVTAQHSEPFRKNG